MAQNKARPDYLTVRKRLDTLLNGLAKIRDGIDARDFDVKVRAAAIGRGIDANYAFVRDKIAYHPYRGTLRFAQGTLMSRSGNSCDQAALLSALLRHHRHQTRFVTGTLDDGAARKLLALTDQPRAFASRDRLYQPPSKKRVSALIALGISQEWIKKFIAKEKNIVARLFRFLGRSRVFHTAEIRRHAGAAGMTPATASIQSQVLLAAVRAHCWVQVRQGGKWVDLDPAFRDAKPGQRFGKAGKTAAALPASLAYRLAFTLGIEQKKGGRIKRYVVLQHSALLVSAISSMSLRFVPENTKRGSPLSRTKIKNLIGYKVVWPLLVVEGKPQPGSPFDLTGNKLSRDVRKRSLGGIGRRLGALGIGGKAGRTLLQRVTLDLRLIGPGGPVWRVRRVIALRRLATRKRGDLDLRLQLLGRYHIMATGSRIRADLVRRHMLTRIVALKKVYQAALDLAYGRIKVAEVLGRAKAAPVRWSPLLLRYFALRSALIDGALAFGFPKLAAYPAEPQIAIYRAQAVLSPGGKRAAPIPINSFDIVSNRLAVMRRPGTSAGDRWQAAAFAIEQGVLDTLTEYVLLGNLAAVNAAPVMVQAHRRKLGFVILKPSAPDLSEQLARLPAGARQHLRRDLTNGYWVLAPKGQVTVGKRKEFSWWRIHPQTGETLGIGANGEGQSTPEYHSTQRISLSTIGLSPTYKAELCLMLFGFGAIISGATDNWKDFAKAAAGIAICMATAGAAEAFEVGGNVPWSAVGLGALYGLGAALELFVGVTGVVVTLGALPAAIVGFGALVRPTSGYSPPAGGGKKSKEPHGWCEDFDCEGEEK